METLPPSNIQDETHRPSEYLRYAKHWVKHIATTPWKERKEERKDWVFEKHALNREMQSAQLTRKVLGYVLIL